MLIFHPWKWQILSTLGDASAQWRFFLVVSIAHGDSRGHTLSSFLPLQFSSNLYSLFYSLTSQSLKSSLSPSIVFSGPVKNVSASLQGATNSSVILISRSFSSSFYLCCFSRKKRRGRSSEKPILFPYPHVEDSESQPRAALSQPCLLQNSLIFQLRMLLLRQRNWVFVVPEKVNRC